MTERKRVAIYARVSTTDQTAENQLLDLRAYCASHGWTIVREFVDRGFSGSQKDRPALDQLMAFVRGRHCQRVLVWRYDRFARSVSHLVNTLEYLRERGVEFASYQERIDTQTAEGRLFFTFVAGIAAFERELIIERIRSGLRRARAEGRRIGRPGIPQVKVDAILALRGQSSRSIAAQVGLGHSVVAKVLSTKPRQNVAPVVDGEVVA